MENEFLEDQLVENEIQDTYLNSKYQVIYVDIEWQNLLPWSIYDFLQVVYLLPLVEILLQRLLKVILAATVRDLERT